MTLLPLQERARAEIAEALGRWDVVALVAAAGFGKSVLLRAIAAEHGAAILDIHDYLDALKFVPPFKWQAGIREHIGLLIQQAPGDLVILDDYLGFTGAWGGSLDPHYHHRILADMAVAEGKKFLVAGRRDWEYIQRPWIDDFDLPLSYNYLRTTGPSFAIVEMGREGLAPDDYRQLFANVIAGGDVSAVDFEALHYAAPRLRPWQLRQIADHAAAAAAEMTTDSVLALVNRFAFGESIETREVEPIPLDQLAGTEAIAEALETHLVIPFEKPELALKHGIKPKRGIMLYGPPGTGKTAIGRALAHRLKGRFFLIDGTLPSDPPDAFQKAVEAIVEQAKANVPAVIFVDDADLLLEMAHLSGFERLLLSLLDGLENDTTGKICVMMTVMDPAKIPVAILRSGRVELWLEVEAPDAATRADILRHWVSEALPARDAVDFDALAAITQGFTPADLRRVANDAKLLYAGDRARERPVRTAQLYLRCAIDEVLVMRERMDTVIGAPTLSALQGEEIAA